MPACLIYSSLIALSPCFYPPSGSGEDWLDAINEVRQEYQEEFGGTYIPLKWSPDLAAEAQKWANDIAEICKNGTPGTRKNPNDFGVSTILNMRNPQLAVDRWVQNGECIKPDQA